MGLQVIQSPVASAEQQAQELIEKVRSLGRPLREDEAVMVAGKAKGLREEIAAAHLAEMARLRTPVVAHGGRSALDAVRRAQEEARRRLERHPCSSSCPAATVQRRGPVVEVLCGVEGSELTSRSDPQSILTFCVGEYVGCPSWRAEKEREQRGGGDA